MASINRLTLLSAARITPNQGVEPPLPEEPQQAPHQESIMQHEVRLARVQSHFVQALCTCGWVSAARRAESLAAQEGRDHSILYDGAFNEDVPDH